MAPIPECGLFHPTTGRILKSCRYQKGRRTPQGTWESGESGDSPSEEAPGLYMTSSTGGCIELLPLVMVALACLLIDGMLKLPA